MAGDAPVTMAQLEEVLARMLSAQKQEFVEALADQKQELLGAIADQRQEFIEHMEGVETRLLTAFQRWASPVDRRVRKLEITDNDLGERLAMMEERISDLERQRSKH